MSSKSKWSFLKQEMNPDGTRKYPDAPLGSMTLADKDFLAKVDEAKFRLAELTQAELQERLIAVRAAKSEAEDEITEMNVEIEALGRLILKWFEVSGITQARSTSGHLISASPEPYPVMEDREKFEKYVEENPDELGYLWSISHPKLAALMRDILEAGEEWKYEGVKPFIKTQLKVTKS